MEQKDSKLKRSLQKKYGYGLTRQQMIDYIIGRNPLYLMVDLTGKNKEQLRKIKRNIDRIKYRKHPAKRVLIKM